MKLTEEKNPRKTLGELETDARKEIQNVDGKRQDIAFKKTQGMMDAGFYFSVVFATKKERDEWCLAKGLKLREESYILSKDLVF